MESIDSLQEVEDPGVVVFQCEKCNIIVGDSSSWIGVNDELGTMTLASSTKNVQRCKTLITSTEGPDVGSTYVQLKCLNCKELLGKMYQTTPKNLDSLRDTFAFDFRKVKSYEVGSGRETGCHYENSLPSYHFMAQQLQKVQAILVALNHRLAVLETNLPPSHSEDTLPLSSNNNTNVVPPIVRMIASSGVSIQNDRKTKAQIQAEKLIPGKRKKVL